MKVNKTYSVSTHTITYIWTNIRDKDRYEGTYNIQCISTYYYIYLDKCKKRHLQIMYS